MAGAIRQGAIKWTNSVMARLRGDAIQFGVENWVDPLSWSNTWGNTAAITAPVQFYKDPFGIVRMRGTATRGTPVGAMAQETILTLPEGYRPQYSSYFVCKTGTNAQSMATSIEITSAGVITALPGWFSGWDGAGNLDTDLKKPQDTRLTFDGVSFRVPVDG